jgi:DNA sulfur modification protein DndB
MSLTNSLSFPAIRGIQASREYFSAMCPLKLVPKIFMFTDEELRPELRAQRVLNKSRIPEIADYLVNNPRDYVFSSITASIDAEYEFKSVDEANSNIGMLTISMDCKFVINDGQHRRAAIEEALKIRPELGNESISVVFFIDEGLRRSQQLFSDLNRHAIRPTSSIGILYDHRDPLSSLTREIISEVKVFNGLTEKEKSSISNRSTKLFTLSSIHNATKVLLEKSKKSDKITEEDKRRAIEFWSYVTENMSDWKAVKNKDISSATLREEYVHAHGVALQALGEVGRDITRRYPKDWKSYFKSLDKIDWSRANTRLWEGKALINGRVSKSADSVKRTSVAIKKQLKIPLTKEDQDYTRTSTMQ